MLTRWHAVATIATNPLTDEREQIERAKASDYTGLNIPASETMICPIWHIVESGTAGSATAPPTDHLAGALLR
jgi:hypothetical protein